MSHKNNNAKQYCLQFVCVYYILLYATCNFNTQNLHEGMSESQKFYLHSTQLIEIYLYK